MSKNEKRRVNRIEVTDSKYEIFGVKTGYEFDDAVDILRKQGFKQGHDELSYYW